MSYAMTSHPKFAITTLGCKVNQCESDAICRKLESKGLKHISTADEADICIVNTCTVTQKASMQSRQAIRKAIKNYPRAKIIVTGCYAQTAPEELARIEGVSTVIDNTHKMALPDLLGPPRREACQPPQIIHQSIHHASQFAEPAITVYGSRTRPFLKIQDGCNAFCTYCIVPYARGRSRSMPINSVMEQLKKLAEAGFMEVVLTGIHLGCYGQDFLPPKNLSNLLAAIDSSCPISRVRISSIEPMELTEEIISRVAASAKFCPHFHIPLQSGDNTILSRMKRPYRREEFEEKIRHIHSAMPHAAIGADVLVGFPGESQEAFENTFSLIQSLPVSYLHVFPFSPRKNTPAANYPDKVPQRIVGERCKLLRKLGQEKRRQFYTSQVGRDHQVLLEGTRDRASGKVKGFTGNYLPVLIAPSNTAKTNTLVKVRISHVTEDLKVWGALQTIS